MLTQKDNHLLLAVKVVPNASRTQLAGTLGNALKVKVAQPPEDNRANRAVIDLLATTLALPPGQITLVSGQTRPQKTFALRGITCETAKTRLLSALPAKRPTSM